MGFKKKPVVMVDKITGQIVKQFKSAYDAAKANPHIPYYSLCNMCQRKTIGYQTHVFRYLEDYKPYEPFENRRYNKPVELTDGDKYIYVSNRTDAAKILHCTNLDVSRAIVKRGKLRGFSIRYLRFMGDISTDDARVFYTITEGA